MVSLLKDARLSREISALEEMVARERRRVKALRLTKMRVQQGLRKPSKRLRPRLSIEAAALRMEVDSLEAELMKIEASRDEACRLLKIANDKLEAMPSIWAQPNEARVLEAETRKLAMERATLEEDARLVTASMEVEHEIRILDKNIEAGRGELAAAREEEARWKTKLKSEEARRDPVQRHVDQLRQEVLSRIAITGTTVMADALFDIGSRQCGGDKLTRESALSLIEDVFGAPLALEETADEHDTTNKIHFHQLFEKLASTE